MRDIRLVAMHRGGLLKKAEHRRLMGWAWECAGRALPLINTGIDERLILALQVAKEWEAGNAPVGDAMKASAAAHAVARAVADPVAVSVARAVGHAVATAHMADHSLGAALYSLKAMKLAGLPSHDERAWQVERLRELCTDVADVILKTMQEKGKGLKV